jgi:lipoprotein-releasing system permease protein
MESNLDGGRLARGRLLRQRVYRSIASPKHIRAMGATPALIRNTFLGVGLAISSLGACVGVGLGIGLCWLQDQYKLVSMGMQAAIVQEYPVRVLQPDLWLIASTVILVSLAVSWVPAQGAVLAAKAGTRA